MAPVRSARASRSMLGATTALVAGVLSGLRGVSLAVAGCVGDCTADGAAGHDVSLMQLRRLGSPHAAASGAGGVLPAAGGRKVELVVERHCEDLMWVGNISRSLWQDMKVTVPDKCGNDCTPKRVEDFPQGMLVQVQQLENVGRDGHDQLWFISQRYDSLAPFTAFVQGAKHWSTGEIWENKAKGWKTQSAALDELIPMAMAEDVHFLPIASRNERGPIFWQDGGYPGEPQFPPEANIRKFLIRRRRNMQPDMHMRARELYALLFGVTPCEAPAQVYTVGMQFIVSRDRLLSRPRKFYSCCSRTSSSATPALVTSTSGWSRRSTAAPLSAS